MDHVPGMIVRLFIVPSMGLIEHLFVSSLMVEMRVVTLEAPTVFCRESASPSHWLRGTSCLWLYFSPRVKYNLSHRGRGRSWEPREGKKRKEAKKKRGRSQGTLLVEQEHVGLDLKPFFGIRFSFIPHYSNHQVYDRAVSFFLSVHFRLYLSRIWICLVGKHTFFLLSYVRCWENCALIPHPIGEKL